MRRILYTGWRHLRPLNLYWRAPRRYIYPFPSNVNFACRLNDFVRRILYTSRRHLRSLDLY